VHYAVVVRILGPWAVFLHRCT